MLTSVLMLNLVNWAYPEVMPFKKRTGASQINLVDFIEIVMVDRY
jgi:hypothetical protein